MIVFDHVEKTAVSGLGVQGDKNAESTLRVIDSKGLFMSAVRLLSPAKTFAQIEGVDNQNIAIDGADLSQADKPLVLANGAKHKAVKLRVL